MISDKTDDLLFICSFDLSKSFKYSVSKLDFDEVTVSQILKKINLERQTEYVIVCCLKETKINEDWTLEKCRSLQPFYLTSSKFTCEIYLKNFMDPEPGLLAFQISQEMTWSKLYEYVCDRYNFEESQINLIFDNRAYHSVNKAIMECGVKEYDRIYIIAQIRGGVDRSLSMFQKLKKLKRFFLIVQLLNGGIAVMA